MAKVLQLIIGGAIGTIARYVLAGAVYGVLGSAFPYGTLVVNTSGCFILGILSAFAEHKFLVSTDVRTLLMIGFCGAFTTFSTLIFETDGLIRDGESMKAFMNVAVSLVAGFIFFRIGMFLADII